MTIRHQIPPPTKVVLTIDTEPSVGGAFLEGGSHTPLLREPVGGCVNGKSEALGFVLNALSEYGLTATFFVETLHTRYFSDYAMGEYVEAVLQAGQDVQLHLHPCWLTFERRRSERLHPDTDDCHRLEEGRLAELINEGAEKIATWTGRRATGMRTGNFSTSLSVFKAMRAAGLRHASNICMAIHRPPESELMVEGGVHEFSGICELPVTCFRDVGPIGRGRLRPLSITATTAVEQIKLLKATHAMDNDVAVILTHPFEFVKKRDFRYTGLRPNRIVQRRFRHLCSFLATDSNFQVLPLGIAAEALDVRHSWSALTGGPLRSVIRAAENFVNDHIRLL